MTPKPAAASRQTFWNATAREGVVGQPLAGDARGDFLVADVLVIGCGYAGASLALHLAESGARVAVLEAREPGAGASGRNASAMVGMWAGVMPAAVVQAFGAEQGGRMNRAIARSGTLVRDLVARHGIAADLSDGGLLMGAHKPEAVPLLQEMAAQWSACGAVMDWVEADRMAALTGHGQYAGGLLMGEGATLNPVALARGLARAAQAAGARIFTESPVAAVTRRGALWRAETARGAVEAETLVIAANTDAGRVWPGLEKLFLRLPYAIVASRPVPEYLATRLLPGGIPYVDSNPAAPILVRLDSERRIIGSLPPPLWGRGNAARVAGPHEARLRRLYGDLPPIVWDQAVIGFIDAVPDRLPKIFRLGERGYALLGFSGQGIANAVAMGKAVADLCTHGREAEADFPVVDPKPVPLAGPMAGLLSATGYPLVRLGLRFGS